MHDQHIPDRASLYAAECRFLRKARWWLPALFSVVVPVAFVTVRAFLLLDASALRWPGWPAIVALAVAGLIAGVMVHRLWSREAGNAPGRVRSRRFVGLVALLFTVCVELIFRQPSVARHIWTAVKTRSHPVADFFIRNVATFHLACAGDGHQSAASRLLVFGSSQLNLGLDHNGLQSMLPSMQVERRSLAGMGPSRMLMTSPFLEVQRGDVVLVYWSEFDFGAMSEVNAGWLRAFGNLDGLSQTLDYSHRAGLSINYKARIDMCLSSLLQMWRMRDGMQLVLHAMTGAPGRSMTPEQLPGQIRSYADGLHRDEYFRLGMSAAETLIRQWREAGAKVVVLEGSINPAMDQPLTPARRQIVAEFLARVCQQYGAEYVALVDQSFKPGPDDWVDGTHLNRDAMISFTKYVADLLKELAVSDT